LTVLEAVVQASFARVEQVAWTEWSTLGEHLASDAALKALSPRAGFVDFSRHDDADGTRHLVAGAFLPFRAGPPRSVAGSSTTADTSHSRAAQSP
jgi:hypothetical protein